MNRAIRLKGEVMAHSDTISGLVAAPSVFSLVSNKISVFKYNRLRRKAYNKTVRSLKVLSDRELHDIGLHRSQIDGVAFNLANFK